MTKYRQIISFCSAIKIETQILKIYVCLTSKI